jgi:uncharacterized RDD family membrane protein YckC
MDQAGGVCTSRDAQASGMSRVAFHRTRPEAIRQWTVEDSRARRPQLDWVAVSRNDRTQPEGDALTSPDAPKPFQYDRSTASSRLLPPGLTLSDTPSRLMALLLDGFAVGAIGSVPLSLLGFDYPTRIGLGAFPDRNLFVATELVAVLINASYFIWFWSGGRRATPGQRIFSIQVANAFDGLPLSRGQALKRWFATGQWLGILALPPFLFLALLSMVGSVAWDVVLLYSAITNPTKQGFHDRFASSAVVRPAGAGNRWAAGCLWALVIAGSLYVLFLLAILNSTPASYTGYDRMMEDLRDYFRWLWPS